MTTRLLLVGGSGWLLVLLLGATIRLPYRARRSAPRFPRLRLHYWLGYAIAALALVHGSASMTRAIVSRAHPAGLWVASGAVLLAFAEVALGLFLRRAGPRRRGAVRRIHFWVMAALAAAVVVHVALDSALLRTYRFETVTPVRQAAFAGDAGLSATGGPPGSP